MRDSKTNRFLKNVYSAAAWILAGIVVFLALATAYNIAVSITPETYDPGVLLTAAALALFILAFLISILALFGWRELNNRIRDTVKTQMEESRKEYQGLVKLTIGLFYGRMCRIIDQDRIKVERKDLLQLALVYTRDALALLQEDAHLRWVATNNLTFYMALEKEPAHGPKARELAEKLLEQHSLADMPHFLNTYALVVATYSMFFEDPQKTLRQARDMLQALIKRTDIKENDRKDARRHILVLNNELGSGNET